ncbi:T9SS type A sorting domain-containing protein [Flavobacterium sp. GCM10027622]|uniref:T9SS type A sorting domain-containing protein n=1 Tax=unclassified Flavobacterium TaxID=196869 RepID=UPI00361B7247
MKITRLLFLLCICTFRSFGQDCGFSFTLNADATDICPNGSVNITMSDSETGIDYNLVDVSTNSTIATIANSPGGTITFNGVFPSASTTYKVTAGNPVVCDYAAFTTSVTVYSLPDMVLSSVSENQTVCINAPLVDISFSVTNATGASASNLPPGVTGNYDSGTGIYTISGSPTVSGTFNYTVTTSGGCNPSDSLGGTITVTPAMTLALTSANNNQTRCVNAAIANITYAVGNATGASASGLPAGVTGSYNSGTGVYTISGSPTVSGAFNYTVTTNGGCNPSATLGGTFTVTPAMTLALTSANNNQTRCVNVAIANITYAVGNATGASASGLPAGVTGSYNSGTGVFTISGAPTVTGSFNYTVTTSGGCTPAASLGGTITVPPAMSLSLTSSNNNQTVCINAAIANITYNVGNATGASISGLPAGVSGNYSGGIFTISGTPTVSGTFNYTVTTSGGCTPAASLGGTITVTPAMTIALTTANNNQTVCINSSITNIRYSIGNGTGALVVGLPAGLSGTYNPGPGTYTISGSPTVSGTFNYTVSATGGCNNPPATLGGTITVTPAMSLALTSANNVQNRCINVAIGSITYTVSNATGASVTGLPGGVTGSYSGGLFTISGTPTASGTFNYTVTTNGGCNPAASLGGTITVTPAMTLSLTSANNNQTVCISTALANINYNVGNATGASASGLPSGVVGNYNAGVFTISGVPTVSGTFNYSVTTSGGCNPVASLGGTITVTPAMTLALTSANNVQTRCINVAIANITYTVGNSTGASASGLPAGVTGNYSGGTFTISGTPTVSGTFNYSVTTSGGCNPVASLGGTITVTPAMTLALTSANNVQTRCINVAIANITYNVGNATGASASGLPAGVTGNYSGGIFTISGTPTASGTFNYTVTTSGGCNPAATLGGTITVTPAMTLALTSGNNNQTRCINVAIANITYSVGNSTGASASGLPAGITGNYSGGIFTISGTPTVSGTFNYTVNTIGGCNPVASLGGTITVTPAMTLALTSANNNQTRCINVAIANISYNVGNATGASATGLPAGVTGIYSGGIFTISGTPTASGTFNYTVTTSGGCNPVASLGGTITVTPAMTLALTSANNNQTRCINVAIANITYSVGNSTGASVVGLPSGVNGNYSGGIFTISGSPTVSGTFNYTVTTTGGCNPAAALGGTITVTPAMTLTLTSANNTQTVCNRTPIVTITYSVGNATGASVSGLPAGVTGNYSAGVFTISGSPTVFGTFNYTVTTSGGCNPVASLGGTITSIQESIDGAVTISQPGVTPVVNIITLCHSGSGTLYLSGHVGAVLRWEYSSNGGLSWIAVDNTSDTYDYVNLTQSTVFRAVVQNTGLCSIAYSASSMVNVIPNVKPNPVVATPPIICNGQSSVLTSQSGFATSQNLATGGTFNDANPGGWGTDGQFTGNYLSSSGSNTNENPFALSASNNGTYSGILCGSSGKFAIVHGDIWGAPNNGTSYMETMAFSTFGLSSANLQFNHAYRLYPGANIKIELSLNGGTSYPITLYTQTGSAPYVEQTPFNIFTTLLNLNLDAYIGQPNMRIKFTYFSNNTDSLWVLDNITIPQAPVGLTTEWVDVSTNTVISTTSTATVSPTVTTTYAVTSLLSGCASTGPEGTTYVTVTVNPRPTAAIGTSHTICNNTSTTLSINLTGTGPWSITYNDGTVSTTVNNVNTNPYIITTPVLTTNKTYIVTALSDANCVAVPADILGSAVVTVLNGTVGLWTGAVSDDWFDCLNWAGGVPTINDDAVIPAGVPNMPVISGGGARSALAVGPATARDLIVNTNASLTMNSGSILQIGRNWRNSGVFNYGTGTVEFVGSTLNQVQLINTGIKTDEGFYNLTLRNSNGAKGVNLPDAFELTVENNLTLESGDLRLTGEAQLVQLGEDSNPLVGTGKLLRDQQGTKSSRHYNYWSSPVSTDNVNYSLGAILKDGTDVTTNPFSTTNILFGIGYDFADGPVSNPIKISTRWIYKYSPSSLGYNGWISIAQNGSIKAGEGFTMKGVDGTALASNSQNYVFTGKPNNGDITLPFGAGQKYLVGNPYASALDADEFIRDNIKDGGRATTNVINGALYFWDHFGGYSHYLADYVGGYATYTLMGGVVAVSNDPNTANTGQTGSKIPKKYIPVAQGFFVSSSTDNSLIANNPNLISPITGGTLVFKNNQRKFARESGGNSLFIRPGEPIDESDSDAREKIRITFKSPSGTYRQLLLGADPSASSYYDLAYDAPMIDVKPEDMYWQLGNSKFIIQALSDFNSGQKVALGIKIETPGVSTIAIDNLENIANHKEIYIYDELTGISHDLRASNFEINLEKGEYLNRFSLRFAKPILNTISDALNVYFTSVDYSLNITGNKSIVKEVYVFDILGQLVVQPDIENPSNASIKIPIKQFAQGTYIVKVISNNGELTKKIVLE